MGPHPPSTHSHFVHATIMPWVPDVHTHVQRVCKNALLEPISLHWCIASGSGCIDMHQTRNCVRLCGGARRGGGGGGDS